MKKPTKKLTNCFKKCLNKGGSRNAGGESYVMGEKSERRGGTDYDLSREVPLRFPLDFEWGVATSAFQIEGAWDEDGKGLSIWDDFLHKKGIHDGDLAIDHYHRWRDDIELISELGVKSYRMSLSWPRLFPTRESFPYKPNPRGVEFYRNLLGALNDKGIKVYVTLYHWDLPLWLHELGGWLSKDMPGFFRDYAMAVSRLFGDLVDAWIPLNERIVVAYAGYTFGNFAPGLKGFENGFRALLNTLKAHAVATPVLRRTAPVGTAVAYWIVDEVNLNRKLATLVRQVNNDIFIEPHLEGKLPQEPVNLLWDFLRKGAVALPWYLKVPVVSKILFSLLVELQGHLLKAPPDFLGVNIYSRHLLNFSHEGGAWEFKERALEEYSKDMLEPLALDAIKFLEPPSGWLKTEMDWEVNPSLVYRTLKELSIKYPGIPIYITETGASFPDVVVQENGELKIHDHRRIEFLHDYFASAWDSISDGVPLKGIFVWSIFDNIEWVQGRSKRFGLVYIDYENNLRRIPKDSFFWYQRVIKDNCLPFRSYWRSSSDACF